MPERNVTPARLKVGISSCLLGNEVRYDGNHSYSADILAAMGDLFELVPFCPEVAIGLGIPRAPINLVNVDGVIRVRGVSDPQQDVTDSLNHYALSISDQFNEMCGYIFKSRSPSCGLSGVSVYDSRTNQVVNTSPGQFAKIIIREHPQLPAEDESRLSDKNIRDDFIGRVVAYSLRKNVDK